jgi:hypothetical protein
LRPLSHREINNLAETALGFLKPPCSQ